MYAPTYLTAAIPEQSSTSQKWWQGLFSLGQEAIRRAMPLPGEAAGGVSFRPSFPVQPEPPQVAGIPMNTILIAGALLVGFFLLKK